MTIRYGLVVVGEEEQVMMSVHEALLGWQAGEITSGRAMALTGAADVMELYAFAEQCGVEMRTGLLPREEEQAAAATALIQRAMAAGGTGQEDAAPRGMFAGSPK